MWLFISERKGEKENKICRILPATGLSHKKTNVLQGNSYGKRVVVGATKLADNFVRHKWG